MVAKRNTLWETRSQGASRQKEVTNEHDSRK